MKRLFISTTDFYCWFYYITEIYVSIPECFHCIGIHHCYVSVGLQLSKQQHGLPARFCDYRCLCSSIAKSRMSQISLSLFDLVRQQTTGQPDCPVNSGQSVSPGSQSCLFQRHLALDAADSSASAPASPVTVGVVAPLIMGGHDRLSESYHAR